MAPVADFKKKGCAMTTTTVKTKGLQFKADMVRSILDGKKTMTRRLVKPQPETRCGEIEMWMKVYVKRQTLSSEWWNGIHTTT